jgi:hypothetical protein
MSQRAGASEKPHDASPDAGILNRIPCDPMFIKGLGNLNHGGEQRNDRF